MTPPFLLRLLTRKPFRGTLRGPEDGLAIEFANDLRAWTLEGRLRATFTMVPHEVGYTAAYSPERNKAKARYAKALAQGLIPGSADYCFVWSDGGGWLELKSATGSPSPDQRDFREWCKLTGSHYAVGRSRAECEAVLRGWGVLR